MVLNDNLNPLKNFNAPQLYRKLELSNEEFNEWLMTLGLLWRERKCTCGAFMSIKVNKTMLTKTWKCKRKSCRKSFGYLKETWFEESRISIKEIFQLSYFWCRQTHTQEEIQFDMQRNGSNISRVTITDWNNFYREVCVDYFVRNPIKIGGMNVVVEIDETCISKRKYERGRLVSNQKWFFGGVERETGNCFIVPVEMRNASTLLPIIQEFVLPGSIIVSDLWRAYLNIEELPQLYTHLTVNHSLNFVDPESGAHTQTIEGTWMHFKRRHKEELGTSRALFSTYIAQFLWRRKFCSKDAMFFYGNI